jgi:hypothetical protein
MTLSDVTDRALHAVFAGTSVAAVFEMAGGAPADECPITIAAISFAVSIPINLYGWIGHSEDLIGGKDQANVFANTSMSKTLVVAGAFSTLAGIIALLWHFSWIASAAVFVLFAMLLTYELRTRSVMLDALNAWNQNETRGARLEAWKLQTKRGEKEFDRIVRQLRKDNRWLK